MQDEFYILKPAVDTEETGHVFPAVESYEDYDFNAPNSVNNLDSDSFPDFTPIIRFKLVKGAKLCDVMGQATISACGLLISQKVKNIFEKFNLVPHKYFDATIEDNSVIHKYYWIHFVWKDGINYLNFENSKFQINEFGDNIGEIKIKNYKELLEKQADYGFMKTIYNYKTEMYDVNYDLFIHPLNKTIYISEKVNNSLLHQSLKGIDLSVASNLLMR